MRKLIFICLIMFSLKSANELPQDFIEHKIQKIIFDSGKEWNLKTNFNIYEKKLYLNSTYGALGDSLRKTKLNIYQRSGLSYGTIGSSLYYHLIAAKNNYFGYLYSRIVSNPNSFNRFTGLQQKSSRFGFSSGETDLSGVGYLNDWMLFQIGRGRQDWSSGSEISLAISESSPPYDYILFKLNFGKVVGSYFHGFLENDSSSNRYITGRGVEWRNNSLILTLSEVVIYSGFNRGIDFSYLNPLSTHLEIELNDKQNRLGTDSGNAIWQFSVDYMFKSRFRISCNYLIDELILDNIQKKEGKSNGLGFSGRISYLLKYEKDYILSTFLKYVNVGTNTMRHESGSNNFVIRNHPLGWKYGSDGYELSYGLKYYLKNKFLLHLEGISAKIGSSSLLFNPYDHYEDYASGRFPSGHIENVN
ncbi:hypothetical protein N9E12_04285, partial [Candidatus Marinimicrobia bacterium]|nr:hypothetical protein [Candidatus Neomarinimicrobiota bacterium]